MRFVSADGGNGRWQSHLGRTIALDLTSSLHSRVSFEYLMHLDGLELGTAATRNFAKNFPLKLFASQAGRSVELIGFIDLFSRDLIVLSIA